MREPLVIAIAMREIGTRVLAGIGTSIGKDLCAHAHGVYAVIS